VIHRNNVAQDVNGKPHRPDGHPDAIEHCWIPEEAATFLQTTKNAGPQPAAFYALALDSGMRKSELCGLAWPDFDLVQGKVHVRR